MDFKILIFHAERDTDFCQSTSPTNLDSVALLSQRLSHEISTDDFELCSIFGTKLLFPLDVIPNCVLLVDRNATELPNHNWQISTKDHELVVHLSEDEEPDIRCLALTCFAAFCATVGWEIDQTKLACHSDPGLALRLAPIRNRISLDFSEFRNLTTMWIAGAVLAPRVVSHDSYDMSNILGVDGWIATDPPTFERVQRCLSSHCPNDVIQLTTHLKDSCHRSARLSQVAQNPPSGREPAQATWITYKPICTEVTQGLGFVLPEQLFKACSGDELRARLPETDASRSLDSSCKPALSAVSAS